MRYKLENKEIEILFQEKRQIEFQPSSSEVYIIDSIVFTLYPDLFEKIGDKSKIFVFNANESSKDQLSLNRIYKFFLERNINRNTRIFGIGGGITTDLTAFAASTYKRGCRLILIPTTLLGMVDATIGGKTGINFENIKNGIGSFYPAEKVIINPEFLKTQSDKNFQAGLIEIVKMSFIKGSNLQVLLNKKLNVKQLIEEAIKTKMHLCEQDFHDRSLRRQLNLGHTFGHVLESISKYEISHGEAVAIGIRAAAKFSINNGFIDRIVSDQIISKLNRFAFSTTFPNKYLAGLLENGADIMMQDKKADDKINLVLFKGLQELFIYKTENILKVLNVLAEFADD